MATRFIFILAGVLVFATPAFAHRPYDVPAGSFKRSDGLTVSVVEHYVDGIIGRDPVTVQFRLLDGTLIAQTGSSSDEMIVRNLNSGADVYRFPSDWVPVASALQHFDGYKLTNVGTQGKLMFSLLLHTLAHLREYIAVLTMAAMFGAGWLGVGKLLRGGWRVFGFVCLSLPTALYVLTILFAASVSPLLLCLFGIICVILYSTIRRFVRPIRATGE